jgi:hypothetical protein
LWAWAAVAVNPHLLKDAEKIEVTSISAPNIVFESPTIRGPYRLSAAKGGLKDPEAVKFLFTETVKHAIEQKNYTAFVALNKNPAQIDLATLQTLTTENGSVFVSAKVITKTAAARVAYAPQLKDGLVEFVPAGVGVQNIPPK